MTIGQKMHETLYNLESAVTDLKSFAMDTQDQDAKKMFNDYAKQLENITNGFKGRVNYLESQNPDYKVRNK